MGQIVAQNAKAKRCNIQAIQSEGSLYSSVLKNGEYMLVSSDNSMDTNGNGLFDNYVIGDGVTACNNLILHAITPELEDKADKANTYTKTEVNNLIPSVDNDIIIGALPSSGVANTIYRVPGTNSYTDYAWDGTQFVALGTFTGNGDIDAAPTADSTNPVQSKWIYDFNLELNGGLVYSMPPINKTLNWEQANHSRKVAYDDESKSLILYVNGVSACNTAQALNTIKTNINNYIQVSSDWWNDDDKTLIAEVEYDTDYELKLTITFKKDDVTSTAYDMATLIVSAGQGTTTFDVKQLLKTYQSTSYQAITLISGVSAIAHTGETYGTSTIKWKGYKQVYIGAIQTLEDTKQELLVSGENIKTINGESLLGNGDIEIKTSQNNTQQSLSTLLLRKQMPSYYIEQTENPTSYNDDSYIDVKVDNIPDGKHYIFFTDTHWDWEKNTQWSPILIQYIKDRLSIKNVIFGGDYINQQSGTNGQFKAKQILGDFGHQCVAAFGKGLISLLGNHDTNIVNQWKDASTTPKTPYSYDEAMDGTVFYMPTNITYDILYKYGVKPIETFWDYHEEDLLDMATNAGFDSSKLADFKAMCMMDFYYDDEENAIRYIVHTSQVPMPNPFGVIFNEYVTPYLIWYYHCLMTTPEGYDVVITMHMLGDPESLETTDTPITKFALMAMGLKTKTNKAIYVNGSSMSANTSILYPYSGQHYFDFRDANVIGKIFFHVGHAHLDGISIITQSSASYANYAIAKYDNSLLDQTVDTDSTNHSVPIPIIWTTTDAVLWNHVDTSSHSSAYLTENDKGTTHEQAFDVVTLQDNAIVLTRIGYGDSRVINIKA